MSALVRVQIIEPSVGYICKPKFNIFTKLFHMPAKSKTIANKSSKTKKFVMGKSATIMGPKIVGLYHF